MTPRLSHPPIASHAAIAKGGHDHAILLNLLGGFGLTVDSHAVRLPESSQRLLVFLALRERPQPRLVVAGNLWPEKSDQRASANLRSALWRARLSDGASLVEVDGPLLQLSSSIKLDCREVEAIGWRLIDHDDCSTPTRDLRQRFFDELLPGWYDDWVIMERERLCQVRLHFLERLVELLVRDRRYAEALDTALRLVAADPFRERSYAALRRVYEAEGSVEHARRCVPSHQLP